MSDEAPQEATPEDSASPEVLPEPTPAPSYAGTKHKIKLSGEEIEVPYEQLVSDYQAQSTSQKKFEEASRLRKEADEILGALESGDIGRLRGRVDPKKLVDWAEKELMDFVQEEELRKMPDSDPNKRAILAERERDRLRQEKEARETASQQQYRMHVEQEAVQELDRDIAQAVQDLRTELGHDIKVTPELFEHISRVMLAELEDNESAVSVPAKKATKQAWTGVEKTVKYYIDTIPTEKLLALLTPAQREAIRRADVSDATSVMRSKFKDKQSDGPASSGRHKGASVDDFFASRDKRFNS